MSLLGPYTGLTVKRPAPRTQLGHDPEESEKQRLSTQAACRAADHSIPQQPPEPNRPRWDPEHAREHHDPTEPALSWLTGSGPIARGENR